MIKKLSIIALCAILLTSCTQPERTTRILDEQGYSEIQIHPYNFMTLFACSEDDTFRTPFTATAQNGNKVRGVVCSGIFKGSTVRFD
jgi:hypothetical protein